MEVPLFTNSKPWISPKRGRVILALRAPKCPKKHGSHLQTSQISTVGSTPPAVRQHFPKHGSHIQTSQISTVGSTPPAQKQVHYGFHACIARHGHNKVSWFTRPGHQIGCRFKFALQKHNKENAQVILCVTLSSEFHCFSLKSVWGQGVCGGSSGVNCGGGDPNIVQRSTLTSSIFLCTCFTPATVGEDDIAIRDRMLRGHKRVF